MIGEHITESEAKLIAELRFHPGFVLLISLVKQSINNDVAALVGAKTEEEERKLIPYIRAKHSLVTILEGSPEQYWQEVATSYGLHPDDEIVLPQALGN